MKYFLLLFSFLIICSCNNSNIKSSDESKITEEQINKILNSSISLDEKYKMIFIDKDFYNSNITDKEITRIGQHFYSLIPTVIVNNPRAYVTIDENDKLQMKVEGTAKLSFNKSFDKYWLKVSTYVDFGNESYLSDTMIFDLTDFSDRGVKFSVLSPIDNRFGSILGKKKYAHLDSRYLQHKPKTTQLTVILGASNIVGDSYEIPILFSDFDSSWNGWRYRLNETFEHSKSSTESEPTSKPTVNNKERKLMYLFSNNGGLIGFFSDGTVTSCPKCDFIPENLTTLHVIKSDGTYIMEMDGTLFVDDGEKFYPNNNKYNEWKLINYEWQIE